MSHPVAPDGQPDGITSFTTYQLPFCFNPDKYGMTRDAMRVSARSMPASSAKLLDLIAAPADKRDFAALGTAGRLVSGTVIEQPTPVFPRYVAPEATA